MLMNKDYLCLTTCMLDTPVLFYGHFTSMTMTNISVFFSPLE
jgi:hypothetical protein